MMQSIIAVAFAILLVTPAFADDAATTRHADGSATENSHDTSKNPITGNTTDTHKMETKDAHGKTVSKAKKKTKRDEHGNLLKQDAEKDSEQTTPSH